MKKALSILAFCGASVFSFGQLAPGTIAPNWTFTDLNNNSWDLYTLLGQGKTVFIDVSATWCGPCWNYHNSHALEDLYMNHGPSGTVDQMAMVFFIEGDPSTTIADLNGTGGNTQGDWVTGTPYPIIDPGSGTNTFNTNYAIGYFPTIYMVCPNDQKIYEVGQLTEPELVQAMNGCAYNDDVLPTGMAPLSCLSTFGPAFTMKNNSFSNALTSCTVNYTIDGGSPQTYNWTGNLAVGQSTTVTLPSQTFTAGSHTLAVTTTSPNGGNDMNSNNNTASYTFSVNTSNGVAAPLTNNCSSSSFPYANWILSNQDNSITWAYNSANTGSLKYDCYNYASRGAIDEFIVEPVDLTGTTTPSLKFDVSHKRYSTAYTEKLDVLVSSDCGTTWTQVWSKSGSTLATAGTGTSAFTPTAANQWRAECVDLSNYSSSNKLFVMFRGTNDYGNNMYVDNINISNTACTTGILNTETISGLQVYPNPASDNVSVSFGLQQSEEVTVNVYNMMGSRVSAVNYGRFANGNHMVKLDVSNMTSGIYFIEVVAGANKTIQKISVTR